MRRNYNILYCILSENKSERQRKSYKRYFSILKGKHEHVLERSIRSSLSFENVYFLLITSHVRDLMRVSSPDSFYGAFCG